MNKIPAAVRDLHDIPISQMIGQIRMLLCINSFFAHILTIIKPRPQEIPLTAINKERKQNYE